MKIIDMSYHQGTIVWEKVAADGVKGAFIKECCQLRWYHPYSRKYRITRIFKSIELAESDKI
ncbi:hypothetical protein P4V47_22320 [Brevibacillus laterosporus]|uniref:hypothetical protein n=1 Tax=Brevibacillus laterosporus TaxID=1465 RepID=UPI002E1B51D0|nr:hypothetical protein [Brevibacillus laterosporus]